MTVPGRTAPGIQPEDELGGGRYLVLEPVGDGGFGSVFRTFDRSMGCDVALKALHATDGDALFRIKREFRTLKPLVHRNLVRLHDLYVAPGESSFFTMELLRGRPLDEFVLGEAGAQLDRDVLRRLCHSVRQIGTALKTVHDRGLVHRDIKPANLQVLRGGRTVLLDFDFAVEALQWDGDVAGSPAFMAPEQMDGEATAASDWYALGVVLRHLARGTPRDAWPEGLGELVRRLTWPEPSERGGYAELVHWLDALDAEPVADPGAGARSRLIGRRSETEALRGSFAAMVEASAPRIAVVGGPSGIGKSTLVNHFLDELRDGEEQALVFSERCHLRESVHLRILDGFVDDLTRHLATLPPETVRALRPGRAAELIRLFPVFDRIAEWQQDGMANFGQDASLVTLGIAALRQLLTRLAESHPLIIAIDDCQWADVESLRALEMLLGGDDAPALLLVLINRDEALGSEIGEHAEGDGDDLAATLARVREESGIAIDEVPVTPLDADAARSLLETVDPGQTRDPEALQRFVASCEGNPLFLTRLSDRFGDGDSMEASLREELAGLEELQRDLVKLVAVSGQPISIGTLSTLYPGAQTIVEQLDASAWLRPRLLAGRECVDVFHDRIRHAVLEGLSDEERRGLHDRIATLLRSDHGYSPSVLVSHFLEAGRREDAARYALEAAEEASTALALNQAASLFERAFQLRGEQTEDRWMLERCAEAQGRAGRYVDSGAVYARVVELLGEDDRPLLRARMYSHASNAYLRGGDVGHARTLFLKAADALGIEFSQGVDTFRSRLKRKRFLLGVPKFRDLGPAKGEIRERLEILQDMVRTVVTVDGGLASELSLIRLDEALRAGDPDFAAHAAMTEGNLQCFLGDPSLASGARLARAGQRWHDGTDPYLVAMSDRTECVVSLFHGEWKAGAQAGLRAERGLLEHLPGDQWELGQVRQYLFINLVNLGNVGYLAERLLPLVDDARERGDIGRLMFYRTSQCALAWLGLDDVDAVRAAVAEYDPLLPADQFSTQHFFVLQGEMLALLYSGDLEGAHERLEFRWAAIERAGMLRTNYWGIELRSYRGMIHLGLAARGASPLDAKGLEQEIREQATQVAKLPGGDGAAAMLEAGLHWQLGRDDRAATGFERAVELSKKRGKSMHALAIGRLLATCRGEATDDLDAAMGELGAADPASLARCYAPELAARPS